MERTKKERPRKTGYDKAFPTRLRFLMKSTKTSRTNLSDHLGVTRQAVANYYDGTSTPSWEGIAEIARFFGCTSDFLLGLDGCGEAKDPTTLSPEESDALKDLIKEKLLRWSQDQEGDPKRMHLLTGIYLKL